MLVSKVRSRRIRLAFTLALAALVLGGAGGFAMAQTRSNLKSGLAVRSAFREVVAKAKAAVVRVRSKGMTLAFGTVVDPQGYILTKASELSGPLTCKLIDGREIEAQIVGIREEYDLAMLKIDAQDLATVEWISTEVDEPGQWVITPDIEEDPLAVGVVSAPRRRIRQVTGVLGIDMEETENGPKVKAVTAQSSAEKAGLKVDDVIMSINRTKVTTSEELINALSEYSVGDTLRLRVRRGEEESVIDAKLGPRPSGGRGGRSGRSSAQNSMGGPLSDRAGGFPLALQHDTVLRPNECGGPLLNLEGKVVGINIARAGRVMSYALPASEVQPLLADLKAGKFAPEPQPVSTAVKPEEKAEAKSGDGK